MDKFITKEETGRLVSSHSLKYEYAPTDWRDGLLLGNGDLGAICYAPGGREWVINKNDVFDGRVYDADITPHQSIMEMLKETGEKYTYFIDKLEKRRDKINRRSITPLILRLCNGNGELGWSAPAFPKITDTLSLYEGEVQSVSDAHFIHSTVKSIVPHGRRVVAIRQEGTAVADWDNKLEIYRPYHEELDEPRFSSFEKGGIAFTQTLPGGIGSYAVAVLVSPRPHGRERITYELPADFDFSERKPYVTDMRAGRLSAYVMLGGDVDVFISVSSEYREKDPLSAAIAEVKAAAEAGFEALEAENREFWHSFWERSMVDFGGYAEYQHYYLTSMYALATAFGTYPMPALSGMLYGPLNATTPGVSAHHYNTDQNIQIPLMPAPLINHPELIEPYADTFIANLDKLRAHTKRLFGSTGGEGIFVPLVANQNCEELTSGCYRYTMCGSAYTGLILARCWEYTRDDELMRNKLYPLLRELIIFYVNNMMSVGEDGLYHLDPTVPPEIFMFTRDDLSTVSMLRACINTALRWCEKEGIEESEAERWRDVLSKYPPLVTREDGSYKGGPDIPDDYFSFGTHQLYPLFPAEEYFEGSEKLTARKTLEYIDRDAIERTYSGEHGWHFIHGWSWFLYYGTMSHLGDGKAVFGKLSDFIRFFAKRNGLFIHNSVIEISSADSERNHNTYKPKDKITADMTKTTSWYGVKCSSPHAYSKELTAPVIEGGSIFLQLSTEMLLSSFDGIIRLFPGIPEDFDGGFKGLKARGGFTVSAKAKNGRLVSAEISSVENAKVKILDTGITVVGKKCEKSVEHGMNVVTFDILEGETVEII